MDAMELRLNNYVYDDANNIVQINHQDIGEELYIFYKPIELTGEILLKCGFLNFGNRWMRSELHLDIIMSNGFYIANVVNEIKHLHQLQNLYFALTGEELNVTL